MRSLDDNGRHTQAVRLVTTAGPGHSGTLFTRLDGSLTAAIAADQAVFRAHAVAGRDAFTGLEVGVIVLALIMAAGCCPRAQHAAGGVPVKPRRLAEAAALLLIAAVADGRLGGARVRGGDRPPAAQSPAAPAWHRRRHGPPRPAIPRPAACGRPGRRR